MVWSYVWELPFGKGKPLASRGPLAWIVGGFQTSGSFAYAGGHPFTVTSGGSLGNSIDPFGAHTAVPILVGKPLTPQSVDCWFYSSRNAACRAIASGASDAFALQAAGQFGNLGRNTFRAPGTKLFDFSLQRDFPIREVTALQFRWEVFNLGRPPSGLLGSRDGCR